MIQFMLCQLQLSFDLTFDGEDLLSNERLVLEAVRLGGLALRYAAKAADFDANKWKSLGLKVLSSLQFYLPDMLFLFIYVYYSFMFILWYLYCEIPAGSEYV